MIGADEGHFGSSPCLPRDARSVCTGRTGQGNVAAAGNRFFPDMDAQIGK